MISLACDCLDGGWGVVSSDGCAILSERIECDPLANAFEAGGKCHRQAAERRSSLGADRFACCCNSECLGKEVGLYAGRHSHRARWHGIGGSVAGLWRFPNRQITLMFIDDNSASFKMKRPYGGWKTGTFVSALTLTGMTARRSYTGR